MINKIKSILLSEAGVKLVLKASSAIKGIPLIGYATAYAIGYFPHLNMKVNEYLAYCRSRMFGTIDDQVGVLESLKMMTEINSLIRRNGKSISVMYLDR